MTSMLATGVFYVEVVADAAEDGGSVDCRIGATLGGYYELGWIV